MRLLLRWFLGAVALLVVAYFVPGIQIANFWIALLAALVLGFINALIKPILFILTLPVNIITLGFFTLVINALLFWFGSSFVSGFAVANFTAAFWGALLLWVINWVVAIFIRK